MASIGKFVRKLRSDAQLAALIVTGRIPRRLSIRSVRSWLPSSHCQSRACSDCRRRTGLRYCKSVPVPPLTLDTEIQKKRFREAEIRKQMRLEAAREMEQA
jgi:hypothetical protein